MAIYPGPFGHGSSCLWGACTTGSQSSGLYMSTFKDQGVPSKVKICLNDGTCTDEFQVAAGATFETPPASNSYNSLSLALESAHGVPSPWYLIMARGGLGLCMNQRLDRVSSLFSCDGDAGQSNNQLGLMDNWASEGGSTGGGGRWKTTYTATGRPCPQTPTRIFTSLTPRRHQRPHRRQLQRPHRRPHRRQHQRPHWGRRVRPLVIPICRMYLESGSI